MRVIPFVFLLMALAVGCGTRDNRKLVCEITLDGSPLKEGTILFVPLDKSSGATSGGEIRDGKCNFVGAQTPPSDKYKVEVRSYKKSGRQVQKPMGKAGELVDELVEAVAPRFNSASELVVEVKLGDRLVKIAVHSK